MSGNGSFTAPPIEQLQPHFPQYEIIRFVANGGMGSVYKAVQTSVERPVALKILPAHLATDEMFRDRFAMEAKAMARLSHKNLVQLYDFGETGGVVWMIQEWVDGRNIFEVMHDEGKLAPKEAAALVAQACEGLGYAHKQGIVHRDVKPANMMVDNDGVLRLMDFGLARATQGGPEGLKAQGGARFATEEYAAPELWDLEAVIDHRVDIFALGVLLYETLTGRRPTGEFQPPTALEPGLDKRFDDVVVRAMQRDPDNRFGSCEELMTKLREIVTTSPKVRLKTTKPPSSPLMKVKAATPPEMVRGASPALGLARPVAPSKKKGSGAKIAAGVIGVLILLAGLGVGLVVLTKDGDKNGNPADGTQSSGGGEPDGGGEDSPRPVRRPDKPGGGRVTNNGGGPRTPKPEARPDPTPTPRPDPDPTPDPIPPTNEIARLLAELDDGVRTDAAAPLKAYREVRNSVEEGYLEECGRQEAAASAAGDLDGVLFWQAEARSIKQSGDPPRQDAGAPPRAIALRRTWRSKVDPLKAPLVSLQSSLLQKYDGLAGRAEGANEAEAVSSRIAQVKKFENFLALAEGKAPPFLEDPFAEEDPGVAPAASVRVGGSLDSLDDQLQAGNLSQLPTGTREFGGNYFLVVPGPLIWNEANEWCERRGGHLATLATREEWTWYRQTLGPEGAPSVFLGARLQGGEWAWITKERWPTNPPWAEGQPSQDQQDVLGWEYGGYNDEHRDEAQAFAIEWEADKLPHEEGLVAGIEAILPAAMRAAYESTSKRLAELETAGDKAGMTALIKSYGRKLVKDEKVLTQQGKIAAAKVVRHIKDDLLVRLEALAGGGSAPGRPAVRTERVAVIDGGDPTDACLYDRKEWKRKGKALITTGRDSENSFYPKLRTVPSIGRGDFKVTLKMTCGRIGATELMVFLGETVLEMDDEEGRIVLRASGAAVNRVRGANLGSLARAGAPSEFVIQRTGNQLAILVNRKEGLKATIHGREIGPVTIRPGSGSLEIEEIHLEGGLETAPKMQRLAYEGSSRLSKSEVQMVSTGNGGLTALFRAWTWNESGRNELWAQRSRDGGKKWVEDYQVIEVDTFEVGMTSFAATCDERRDEMYAVVATGKANQRLYLLKGRNGGRNWSSPEEITATAKKPGWNVRLSGEGVFLKRNQAREGRILLPMHAGTDSNGLHMLVSDSGGREWKVIGPLTESSGGGVDLMEDESGTLWASVGVNGGLGPNGLRTIVSSADGGDTWSAPVQSALPDAGQRGSLAFGVHPDRKPVWYYASAKPVLNGNEQHRHTHLTLFFSRDQGKIWKELRRIHYGGWSHPTIIPLAPDRVAVSYLAASSHSGYEQVRFVNADGLWGK